MNAVIVAPYLDPFAISFAAGIIALHQLKCRGEQKTVDAECHNCRQASGEPALTAPKMVIQLQHRWTAATSFGY